MNDPIASLPFLHVLGVLTLPIIITLLVWTIVIKGIALWKSARNGHKIWFVVMLVANTLGILEIIYLIWFNKPEMKAAPAPVPAPTSSAPEA